MPKEAKKGGKKKGKKGKKKGKGPADADKTIKQLMKCYERNCVLTESTMCPKIFSSLKKSYEESTILTRFILEPNEVEKEADVPVLIEPLLAALRQERYIYITELYIWKYPMSYENSATLALFLERQIYPIKLLELSDCLLDPLSVQRLGRSFNKAQYLTTVNLDYNEFGDDGCKNLCRVLDSNFNLLSLSMCYCDLGVPSGEHLGRLVTSTTIRELYVDGNNLECAGAMEIIKLCVEQAELEALMRAEELKRKLEEEAIRTAELEKKYRAPYAKDSKAIGSAGSGGSAKKGKDGKKKKKKKGKKKKEAPPPPKPGPWIHKLHIADNAIDNLAFNAKAAALICMRLFKKLIMYSDCIEELDLEDNWIGDLAGRELLEALEYRQEEKMSGCKIRTTFKLSADVFNGIVKLGTGLKPKKKGKKKKKKK